MLSDIQLFGTQQSWVDCCWQSADADKTWRWKLACSGLQTSGSSMV